MSLAKRVSCEKDGGLCKFCHLINKTILMQDFVSQFTDIIDVDDSLSAKAISCVEDSMQHLMFWVSYESVNMFC